MRPNKSAAPGSSSSGSTPSAKLERPGGAFHFQNNERPGERQNSEIAHARVVCGERSFFAYVEKCPYCAGEHVHDRTGYCRSIDPWPVFERDGGVRRAGCSTRADRRSYKVLVWEPPLFTASGAYEPGALRVMAAVAERGFLPIIERVWMPRSSVLRRWGDA
jgi:hypothetical protein